MIDKRFISIILNFDNINYNKLQLLILLYYIEVEIFKLSS